MLTLHNDEPTLVDALSRADLVRRVSDAVARCSPPQVFGIHGDWGTGKTSFLHQLQWDLVGDCPQQPGAEAGAEVPGLGGGGRHKNHVTVVWFEAWRYQHEKAPVVALLQEIRAQLPWTSRALEESKKLGEVAIRGALLSLEDLTKRIGIQASKIEEAGRQWEEENLATRLPAHMIREHLEDALGKLLRPTKRSKRRLVVLVDDLDRCESETAYQLLEGIKIYLNLPSCVFVLGMNQEIIQEAVAGHLPEARSDSHRRRTAKRYFRGPAREPALGPSDSHRRRTAKRYLEKLCQNIWHIPLVQEPDELLTAYLDRHPVLEDMASVVGDFDCLPPVPRKIKGYANLLLRFEPHLKEQRRRGRKDPDPERWAQLAVVYTYLYHFHHRIYRLLWKEGREFWEELLNWCSGLDSRAEEHVGHLLPRGEVPESEAEGEETAPRAATQEPPTTSFTKVFHDPATDEVLHVEELVRAIGPITDEEARDHLLA